MQSANDLNGSNQKPESVGLADLKESAPPENGENDNFYQAPKPRMTWGQWGKAFALRFFFPPVLIWDLYKWLFNAEAGRAVGKWVLPAQLMYSSEYKQPPMTGGEWVKAILLRLLFPPILLWDFVVGLTTRFDITILTWLNMKDGITIKQVGRDGSVTKRKEKLIRGPTGQKGKITVRTYDGAELDTEEYLPNTGQSVRCIIHFVSNGACYQDFIPEIKYDANFLNAKVIGFNYRGVNFSTGEACSQWDSVVDGIAQVQRLLDDDIEPQNIILKSHSLGAGIATYVVAYFQERGIPIRLFHDRSFSSVTNVAVGLIRTGGESGHAEPWYRKLFGYLAKPFIKFALSLTGWEFNVKTEWDKIPAKDKEYIVVRSNPKERTVITENPPRKKGEYHEVNPNVTPESAIEPESDLVDEKNLVNAVSEKNIPKDDTIITHYASLHTELKSDRENFLAKLRAKGLSIPPNELVRTIDEIEARKVVLMDSIRSAHLVNLQSLQSRQFKFGMAQNFFQRFVKSVPVTNEEKEEVKADGQYKYRGVGL